jgi:hypothetical protein
MLGRMMARSLAIAVLALCATLTAAHAQTAPPRRSPTVVELYTSQGCTQCPRANRLLGEFSREPDVLALTFAVSYWDYLGWRDTFAQPLFTDRQRDFSQRQRRRSLFTPQLVFNGVREASAYDWDEARAILDEAKAQAPIVGAPRIDVQRLPGNRVRVTVGQGAAPAEPADIWTMSFDPGPVMVYVASGENARRRVAHYNLVRGIYRIGRWDGSAAYFQRDGCTPQCAAIIQEPNGGRILAASFTTPLR